MKLDQNFSCCVAPIPYYLKPKRTCGLGDNISGTGLSYHKFIGFN